MYAIVSMSLAVSYLSCVDHVLIADSYILLVMC